MRRLRARRTLFDIRTQSTKGEEGRERAQWRAHIECRGKRFPERYPERLLKSARYQSSVFYRMHLWVPLLCGRRVGGKVPLWRIGSFEFPPWTCHEPPAGRSVWIVDCAALEGPQVEEQGDRQQGACTRSFGFERPHALVSGANQLAERFCYQRWRSIPCSTRFKGRLSERCPEKYYVASVLPVSIAKPFE